MSFDGYPRISLGDLVEITSGRLNTADAVAGGEYPFFTCAKEVERISHYEHDREAVLLGGNNANGIFPVFYYSGKFTARQRVYIIWSKSDGVLLNRYLFFALKFLAPTLTPEARGTTTRFITLPMLKSLQIPLPAIGVQEEISDTLWAVEDRISSLLCVNNTLDSILQALFRSWFIDFDPVRAKSEGREPEGMSADIAALFPSEFVDSELGPIPKGWCVKPLDEIANFLNGLAMQKYPPEGGDSLPVIKIAQLRKGDAVGADRASAKIGSEYIVGDGDVLFSWSGSLEVDVWAGGKGGLNQHLFKVTSAAYPKWFYYLAVKHHLAGFREIAANKATTMGHIQRRHLSEAKIAVPESSVLANLGLIFEPLFERALLAKIQARSLVETRDVLLPALLSGRIAPGPA